MKDTATVVLSDAERATLECSIAKCFASDAAAAHTANAVQIHGGTGYIRGVAVESAPPTHLRR